MLSYSDIFNYDEYVLKNYKNLEDRDIKFNELHFGFLSCQWRNRLPEDFIYRFGDKLDFYQLVTTGTLSNRIIEKYRNSIIPSRLFYFVKEVNEAVISRYKEFYNAFGIKYSTDGISQVSKKIKIEDIDEELVNLLDWEWISERKDLTQSFIEKYIDYLCLESLIKWSNAKKCCSKEYFEKLKLLQELKS